ncbi:hypothetical protein IGI04_019132, partial [Brassica rapa subsp. trilocularis]
ALFAESLYGLRRKSVRLRLSKGSSKEVQCCGLEKRQRVLSVVLCYRISNQSCMVNITRKGKRGSGFDEANIFTGEETVVSRGDSGNHELSVSTVSYEN